MVGQHEPVPSAPSRTSVHPQQRRRWPGRTGRRGRRRRVGRAPRPARLGQPAQVRLGPGQRPRAGISCTAAPRRPRPEPGPQVRVPVEQRLAGARAAGRCPAARSAPTTMLHSVDVGRVGRRTRRGRSRPSCNGDSGRTSSSRLGHAHRLRSASKPSIVGLARAATSAVRRGVPAGARRRRPSAVQRRVPAGRPGRGPVLGRAAPSGQVAGRATRPRPVRSVLGASR